ncbi:MAG: dipeptidase, partial [Pyrinomonadaceae bacterium]
MMVDVSHVSDQTFWDIVETSSKPIIASHSGVRALVNAPRNLTDDQIRAIARTGGVVSVIFYPAFIEPGWKDAQRKVDADISEMVEAASRNTVGTGSQKRLARDRVREREYLKRLPPVSVARVADHIDYVVKLVGVGHVALGSDFDGIQSVPRELSSSADFPNLTKELLRRGYTAADVTKMLGENILRVMEEIEKN